MRIGTSFGCSEHARERVLCGHAVVHVLTYRCKRHACEGVCAAALSICYALCRSLFVSLGCSPLPRPVRRPLTFEKACAGSPFGPWSMPSGRRALKFPSKEGKSCVRVPVYDDTAQASVSTGKKSESPLHFFYAAPVRICMHRAFALHTYARMHACG